MIMCLIFSIGCFFGAFLFNFNVGWGDKGAREIRNALAGIGGVLLLIPIVHAIITHSGDVGQVLLIGALPLAFVGLFLGVFAVLGRTSSGDKTFGVAFKGAITLEIIALILAVIGAIMTFMEGGAQ